MGRRVEFKVSFELPSGATVALAQAYVQDAVGAWQGSLKPPGADEEDPEGDPMFDLDPETVQVTRLRKAKRPTRG